MQDKIIERINLLSEEMDALYQERQAMISRDKEIEVRVHQLVGAIFELQKLITENQDHQPSAEPLEVEVVSESPAETQ